LADDDVLEIGNKLTSKKLTNKKSSSKHNNNVKPKVNDDLFKLQKYLVIPNGPTVVRFFFNVGPKAFISWTVGIRIPV
jgi:hypothetical protein